MNNNLTLPEMIRALRRRRHLTATQLAQAAGVSRNTVSDIETGKGNPRMAILSAIAVALGYELRLIPREDWDETRGKIRPPAPQGEDPGIT